MRSVVRNTRPCTYTEALEYSTMTSLTQRRMIKKLLSVTPFGHPASTRMVNMAKREPSLRYQFSRCWRKAANTTSTPSSRPAMSARHCDGCVCMSSSMSMTASPLASRRPAMMALCWPKLRMRSMPFTRSSSAHSFEISWNVPSFDPSLTRMNS